MEKNTGKVREFCQCRTVGTTVYCIVRHCDTVFRQPVENGDWRQEAEVRRR